MSVIPVLFFYYYYFSLLKVGIHGRQVCTDDLHGHPELRFLKKIYWVQL